MQEEHQQEPYFLRAKLLEAVDAEYNVKDMPLILEVLGKLEVLNVSKEILETTRLGKTVNEFRRRVKDALLAKRLKDLVKKWREQVIPKVNGSSSVGSEGGPATVPGGNRGQPHNFVSGLASESSSPTALSTSTRVSPAGSFNSNSLSPRIGTLTNYTNNNNTSAHSIPTNRNGSSSIANRSPNHRNPPHLSTSSYANQLVSPSASTASPFLNSRSLVSPHKSRSPGGPTLTGFHSNNSKLSPFPSSYFQSSISSYAPNAETVSRTNAANKRYRELDDSPTSASVEPLSKKPRSAVNGTLDDPTLALDDISRDSYASRGSDHSDGFTSKDRFSVLAPSPATPGQAPVVSPQMPVPGTDSSVPSPTTPLDIDMAANSQSEVLSKRKRRKKKNEFILDTEAILREKIAQAQAEKAKAAREKELQLKDREASLQASTTTEMRRGLFDDTLPEGKLTQNVFVEKYLKSQNELRVKMEREAVDVLTGSDFQGAEEYENSVEKLSKKDKKKLKKKQDTEDVTDDASHANSFQSEANILSKLPPIDPEILKEFANFKYDVGPSPPPLSSQPSDGGGGDSFNSYNKETESVNNLKSLSSTEEKPRKLIDWGDSEDEEELEQEKLRLEREAEADIISQQVQVISEYVTDSTTELLANVALHPELVDQHGIGQLTEVPPVEREIEEEEVDKYIRDEIPNLNGNYDNEGQFREWHETLTVESYKNEPLHILPYTIIDF